MYMTNKELFARLMRLARDAVIFDRDARSEEGPSWAMTDTYEGRLTSIVERHSKEIEILQEAVREAQDRHDAVLSERSAAVAEVERLTRERDEIDALAQRFSAEALAAAASRDAALVTLAPLAKAAFEYTNVSSSKGLDDGSAYDALDDALAAAADPAKAGARLLTEAEARGFAMGQAFAESKHAGLLTDSRPKERGVK